MKKILFIVALIASTTFVACKDKEGVKYTSEQDSTQVDSLKADSLMKDSLLKVQEDSVKKSNLVKKPLKAVKSVKCKKYK